LRESYKVDENLPRVVLAILRESGFDVMGVVEEKLGGADDDQILEICGQEGRVLITQDLDFSDVNLLQRSKVPGIIILRLKNQSRESVMTVVRRLVPFLIKNPSTGKILIVNENRIRIREKDN
jgi:predicted nuclease of predicted toxin-antitoxin system